MVVEIKTVEEWVSYISNEKMDEIWLLVEKNDLGVYSLFGREGENFYRGGGRYWDPIYRKNYEDFLEYIKDFGVFDENSLVKIK